MVGEKDDVVESSVKLALWIAPVVARSRIPDQVNVEPGVWPPTLETEQTKIVIWVLLLFIAVATGLGIALLVIGLLAGTRRPDAEKLAPYECGFEAFEDARMKFDVRYYLIAILFIIFDLEIAFLFPWATVFSDLGVIALVEMGLFLLLLVIGFAYVWKKGALEWE